MLNLFIPDIILDIIPFSFLFRFSSLFSDRQILAACLLV